MLIVTCASLSGGQGKSTVALFLSRKLASLGYPTVTVDADPQNNLTTWLGVDLDGNSPSLLEVLKKQVAIEESLYFVNDNLYLLPSDDALIQAQEYLSMLGSSAMVLRQRLKPIASAFQFCIIDSPPQQTQICLATVGAADALVIPAEASLKGFNSLVRTLALVDELTEIGAFTGIVVGTLPFRDKWIGFNQTLKSRRSIEAMAEMGTPVLPSIRESDQFEKAINQKVMLADLGHEDLEYPFQVLVQKNSGGEIMTDDLLSKIKQKAQQRKDVPTRNTSLLGSSSSGSLSPELEITQNVQIESPPEIDNLPQISKRLAVRLEDELRDQLEMLCKYEKITPETFLEAAFVICQSNPGTMAMVMAEAKDRYGKRKMAGELRRLKTINQKYQQGG